MSRKNQWSGVSIDTDDRRVVSRDEARSTPGDDDGISMRKRAVDSDVEPMQVPTDSEDIVMPLTGNEPHSTMRAKGQLTIPPEIRQAAHLEEDAPVYFTMTDQGILMRPGKIIDASQAWFWTDRWQQMEREADVSFAAGRHKTFDDAESFLADLDS